MKRKSTHFLTFLLFTGIVSPCLAQKQVLVCGDSKVLLVNEATTANDTIPVITWQWDAYKATDLPDTFRLKLFRTIDDCKSVNSGREILVSSSSGAIAWIDIATKKVLFYAEVPMAHSIEMLPGDRIVAAASTAAGGNRIMLFDTAKGNLPVYEDSLYSGHGVVWDGSRKSLFALGYDVLREYKLANWTTDHPGLELVQHWTLPGIGGHDLQLHPHGSALLVTETQGSWLFNLAKYNFEKEDGMPDGHHVKSLNIDHEGQYLYTQTEESWWTFHIRFANPSRVLAFPGMHVYKARWVNKELFTF
jgi:hypothetical protein